MTYGYRGMAGIGNFKPDMMGMASPEGVARAAPPPMQPMDNRIRPRRQGRNPWVQQLQNRFNAPPGPQYMAGGGQFGGMGFSIPTMEQLGLTPPAAPAAPVAGPAQPPPGLAQLQQLMAQRQAGQMGGLGMGGYNPYQRAPAPPQNSYGSPNISNPMQGWTPPNMPMPPQGAAPQAAPQAAPAQARPNMDMMRRQMEQQAAMAQDDYASSGMYNPYQRR